MANYSNETTVNIKFNYSTTKKSVLAKTHEVVLSEPSGAVTFKKGLSGLNTEELNILQEVQSALGGKTLIQQLNHLASLIESVEDSDAVHAEMMRSGEPNDFAQTEFTVARLAHVVLRHVTITQMNRLYASWSDTEKGELSPVLWLYINSGSDWATVKRTLAEMPTEVFESYMFGTYMKDRLIVRPMEDVIPLIHRRSDKYKEYSPEILRELWGV